MGKKLYSVRLEEDLMARVDAAADEADLSRTAFVVAALEAALGETPRPAPPRGQVLRGKAKTEVPRKTGLARSGTAPQRAPAPASPRTPPKQLPTMVPREKPPWKQ